MIFFVVTILNDLFHTKLGMSLRYSSSFFLFLGKIVFSQLVFVESLFRDSAILCVINLGYHSFAQLTMQVWQKNSIFSTVSSLY